MEVLREIGRQLDMNVFPLVGNKGIVMPNTTPASTLILGKEKKHEKRTSRRSESRKRPGAIRWEKRQTRKPWWPASEATPVVSTVFKTLYEKEIDDLKEAYPGTQVWSQDEGMWLLTESSVLDECWHNALFLTGISFVYPFNVRSWGFWAGGILPEPVWMGPRHTNFPDGSVCAFEPADETWVAGQSIITLLDLYTLWALRHFHLEFFGRWPGRQAVQYPYERIRELRADEFCGCDQSDKLYGKCCLEKDLARDRVADAVNFSFVTGGSPRKPPCSILNFIRKQENPPPISKLLVLR